jgi:hypothetical protein
MNSSVFEGPDNKKNQTGGDINSDPFHTFFPEKPQLMKDDITSMGDTQNKIDGFLSKNKGKSDFEAPKQTKMLSQALIQRRDWSKKFGLSNKILYDLFSEFMSMMNLSSSSSDQSDDALRDVLPLDSEMKMTAFNLNKIMKRIHNKDSEKKKGQALSMHPLGLDIPLATFKEYCKALKSQKPVLVDKFLHSLGVEVSQPKSRVSWEIFL